MCGLFNNLVAWSCLISDFVFITWSLFTVLIYCLLLTFLYSLIIYGNNNMLIISYMHISNIDSERGCVEGSGIIVLTVSFLLHYIVDNHIIGFHYCPKLISSVT